MHNGRSCVQPAWTPRYATQIFLIRRIQKELIDSLVARRIADILIRDSSLLPIRHPVAA